MTGMMRARMFRALCAVLSVCAVLWCGALAPWAYAEAPRIGIVLPLTGPLANIGRDLQDAARLQPFEHTLRFEDDAFNPRLTVGAVQKLLLDPEVRGVITFGSGTSLAVRPLLERAQIPHIAIAMSDKVVEDAAVTFRYYIPVRDQARRMKTEMDRRGYRKVLYVASQQEAMLAFVSYFTGEIGVPAERFIEVPPGESDLRSVALRIVNQAPDAVGLLLLPPELSSLPRQMRALGYRGEFFGPAQVGNPDAIESAQGALDGAWFTSADDRLARSFYERFQERFGRLPALEALFSFDAVGLLSHAARADDTLAALRGISSYHGVFGTELTFEDPSTFRPPLGVTEVRGKKRDISTS